MVEQDLEQPGKLERRCQVTARIEQRLNLGAKLLQPALGGSVVELLCRWAHRYG